MINVQLHWLRLGSWSPISYAKVNIASQGPTWSESNFSSCHLKNWPLAVHESSHFYVRFREQYFLRKYYTNAAHATENTHDNTTLLMSRTVSFNFARPRSIEVTNCKLRHVWVNFALKWIACDGKAVSIREVSFHQCAQKDLANREEDFVGKFFFRKTALTTTRDSTASAGVFGRWRTHAPPSGKNHRKYAAQERAFSSNTTLALDFIVRRSVPFTTPGAIIYFSPEQAP